MGIIQARAAFCGLLLVVLQWNAVTANAATPRGVGPEFASHYSSSDSFACIFNPSIKLSIAQVNDDYCDCPDGSDEPGTAACAGLSAASPSYPIDASGSNINHTQALPGFYCANSGHRPSYVPFQYVNDGVCDYEGCCDGSDEWDKVGGVDCANKCKEIGREWRAKDEARQKSMGNALLKRQELVVEAARLRKEVEDRISTLTTQVAAAEIKLSEETQSLEEIEKQEKFRVVKAPGKQGKLSILVSLTKNHINELKDLLGRLREEHRDYRERALELEKILTNFKTEYNPNFNDEGVKKAVRSFEEYAAKERVADDEDLVADVDATVWSETSEPVEWSEFEGADESDVDLLYSFEAYLPPTLRTWVREKMQALRVFLVESGVLASSDQAGESAELTAARTSLDNARNTLDGLRSDLETHKNDLGQNFGPQEIFRALRGQCITRDAGEYTYELCWLDATKQRSRKRGAETNMGNWSGMETIHVDEPVSADGKGLGTGERLALIYENGQACWNGPNRRTTVIAACAEKDEIWRVSEEEKCVYRMEVGSPAVCETVPGQAASANVKDEL